MACLAGLVLYTPTDPDLWGHLASGRDILHQRAIAGVDTYSFTTDRPWINHEWLSEILMYAAYAAFGSAGLIALKVLVFAAAGFLIVRHLRRYVLPFEVRALLFTLAVVGMKPQVGHVRPQLFSILLFPLLLTVLMAVEGGNTLALVALPVIFLFWANLHGSWIVGAGLLAIWTVAQLLNPQGTSSRPKIALAAVASAVSTLVTPFGIDLWAFLLQTVRIDRSDITDWQPVTFSTDLFLIWLAIAATCVILLYRSRRTPHVFATTTLVLLGVGSFRVLRLESLFALGAVMLLPQALARAYKVPAFQRSSNTPPVSRGVRRVVVGLASLAIAGCGVLIVRHGSCMPIEETGNPEPEAASFVLANHLSGRMITWFDWGEYAIWHLSPGIRVSFDGRRETVYSANMIASHLDFYRNVQPAGSTIADRAGADYVWLPKDFVVVNTLRTHGWAPIFEGPISIILGRPPTGHFSQPPATITSRRCFPGP